MKNNNILIVAAHPDDEILGCAGAIVRLIREGFQANTLILGEGISSRGNNRYGLEKDNGIKELRNQAYKANRIIGIKKVFIHDFPDNRFDSIAFLDIVKVIEKIKLEIMPHIIFTHDVNDLNIDHRIIYNAVLTATRPIKNETVKDIYSFEILSSTEWNFPKVFAPDTFFNISNTINKKLKAISEYKAELREFPHPRSAKGVKLNAQYRGMMVGLKYAEAFKCVRRVV